MKRWLKSEDRGWSLKLLSDGVRIHRYNCVFFVFFITLYIYIIYLYSFSSILPSQCSGPTTWVVVLMYRWTMRHSWSVVRWLQTACHSIRSSRHALHACACHGLCHAARCTRCDQAHVLRRTWNLSWKTRVCKRASAMMTTTRHHLTG